MNSLLNHKLDNERVLIRVDFNVPIENGKIMDDFRIRSALPTIKHCLEGGASVVLMSHLGRPDGVVNEELSLIPIGEKLCDLLEISIKFSHDCISEDAIDVSAALQPGEVHLLENLRFHNAETKNDIEFSKKLSSHGTMYVNDAFGTAHRSHASNVGVTKYLDNCFPGFLLQKEYDFLHHSIKSPERPFTIILGGAKISSKLPLITRFMSEADNLIVGGGMAYTFLKCLGNEIGNSIYDESKSEKALSILDSRLKYNCRLFLPSDISVTKDFSSGKVSSIRKVNEINHDEEGIDIGPDTIQRFSDVILNSKTVIWNGPMGVFETESFAKGTNAIATYVSEMTQNGGTSIIGGGDSASAIKDLGVWDDMTHISTGGGASLELLSGVDLPAFKVLRMI